jgi:hypothetical protein
MYESPRNVALDIYRKKSGLLPKAKLKNEEAVVKGVVEYLMEVLADYPAPGRLDRKIGPQEIETVLCKWGSHLSGHYPLYNDLHEIKNSVSNWVPHSNCAAVFLNEMPSPPEQI